MNIASYIDHTLLKPDATKAEIIKVCSEAKAYGFASVCVNGFFTSVVRDELTGSEVAVCTVIGFPLGAVESNIKGQETTRAIENGADEIDMVINISALKDGNDNYVRNDIKEVVKAADGRIVKVILETCLLTKEEKIRACKLSVEAGAHFVKTSTGFSKGGATVEDVKLMKETVGDKALVKASGGVRDFDTAMKVIEAGASRIGASAGIKIVNNEKNDGASGY